MSAQHHRTSLVWYICHSCLPCENFTWRLSKRLCTQVKATLEQQNGAAPTDEETFNELFSKGTVDRQTIRDALAVVKQAAEEKAAAEAAAAAAEQEAAAADAPATE